MSADKATKPETSANQSQASGKSRNLGYPPKKYHTTKEYLHKCIRLEHKLKRKLDRLYKAIKRSTDYNFSAIASDRATTKAFHKVENRRYELEEQYAREMEDLMLESYLENERMGGEL